MDGRNNQEELNNRRKMLSSLYERVREAQRAGEGYVELQYSDFAHLVSGTGLSEGEAAGLFKRLVRGGYMQLYDTSLEDDGRIQYAWVEDLLDPGLLMIGQLPDTHQRLLGAFEEAVSRIERDPNLDEPERRRLTELARRGADVLQALVARGAGDYIFNNLPI
jgi:hypothetical protein